MKTLVSFLVIGLMGAAIPAIADEYDLEPTHTYAYFRINHLNRGFMTGVFTEVQGSLNLDGSHDAKPSVEVTVTVTSLDSWDKKRDEHLLGPDFFNAKRFKTMTFKSTSVEKTGAGEYQVTGQLTIRGKTKTVTARMVRGETGLDPWGGYRTGGNIYLEIDRRDFGISTFPEPAVGHTVTLDLYWEALRRVEG